MQSSFFRFFRSFHKKSVLVSREVKTGLFFSRAQHIPGRRSILEKSEKEFNLSNYTELKKMVVNDKKNKAVPIFMYLDLKHEQFMIIKFDEQNRRPFLSLL